MPRWQLVLVIVAVFGAVFYLRWPTFSFNVWNVDEAIHAGVARTLLDGGAMYRDAIDQRTPLTYYLVAGVFAVAGENNMWAVRACLAAMIAGTGIGIFLLGRRWRGTAAGAWSAAAYVAFSTSLFYAGDANAANTEWYLGFFVTWGAWLFWRRETLPSFQAAVATGLIYSLAFLSKQPALLEIGAPLGLLLFLGASGRVPWPAALRTWLGFCAGYVAAVAITMAILAFQGALPDFYFYAWTYNLVYYGPEVSLAERVASAGALAQIVAREYPLFLAVAGCAIVAVLRNLAQRRPTDEEELARPASLFLGAWLLLSLAGAASAGRVYGHYYIQVLPALSLVAGLTIAEIARRTRATPHRTVRVAGVVIIGTAAATLIWHPLRHGRVTHLGTDPALPIAAAVQAHTQPGDRIFVWGWNPDIYLYADRKPASRFLYCSFITGLVPWTNTGPEIDTSYAIVPGTLETLVREIETRRPTMIVDCSVGPHRRFQKYPIENYPALREAIARHYVEFEKRPFVHRGFRVFLLKDASRLKPLDLAGGASSRLEIPQLFGPSIAEPIPTNFEISGHDAAGRLQRLELFANGRRLDGASFMPSESVALTVSVPFHQLGMGQYQLVVRATAADGTVKESSSLAVECGAASLPPDQTRSFAMPHLANSVAPSLVRAPYGAMAREEAGRWVYFAHAPSLIAYPVDAGAAELRGSFALRPDAYAATNRAPTDGAEFSIDWIDLSGAKTNLFRRLLNPREVPSDRGEQPFIVRLPGRSGRVELSVSPGPAGNAASDWTYWSELLLKNSR